MPDYGSMPFKNKQAANSDRYGRLTSARQDLVKNYNASKQTPEGKKTYMSKLNALDQARMKADPEKFKQDTEIGHGPRSERVVTEVMGTKTSFKGLSSDPLTEAKRRGGN